MLCAGRRRVDVGGRERERERERWPCAVGNRRKLEKSGKGEKWWEEEKGERGKITERAQA